MKTKTIESIKKTFGDTKDLSKALEVAATLADNSSRYYIKEAQAQMNGLYNAALTLEKEVKLLTKQVKASAKRVKQAAKKTPVKAKRTTRK